MRYLTTTVICLCSFVSFQSTAASVKIRWTGIVPSISCSSQPISNQSDIEKLYEKCQSELKIEKHLQIDQNLTNSKIVSFDI